MGDAGDGALYPSYKSQDKNEDDGAHSGDENCAEQAALPNRHGAKEVSADYRAQDTHGNVTDDPKAPALHQDTSQPASDQSDQDKPKQSRHYVLQYVAISSTCMKCSTVFQIDLW